MARAAFIFHFPAENWTFALSNTEIPSSLSFLPNGSGTSSTSITGATNASPIVITATGHGLITGQGVYITGVAGNTNANGYWVVTVIDANTFSLNGSSGNAAYTSGGTVFPNSALARGPSHLLGSVLMARDACLENEGGIFPSPFPEFGSTGNYAY